MNQKSAHTPIPRYRAWTGPALLAQGFRPFFLAAAVWAAVAPGLLVAWLLGAPGLALPADPFPWHGHEMVFGFAGAALAGFLLTAIPNWTGRLPLQGGPLAALVATWLGARVGAWLLTAGTAQGLAAALVLLFPAALIAVIGREIVAGRNWRNLPVLVAVGVLLAAEALFAAGQAGLFATADGTGYDGVGAGLRLGLAVFAMLVSLIGGRITPSFTTNWLKRQGGTPLPPARRGLEIAALGLTALAVLGWALLPAETTAVGWLALAAAVAALLRLARWQGWRALKQPLLWGLHLGYLWVVVGLLAVAGARLGLGVPEELVLHAIGAGAMGTMILTVMARATLGHTGRTPEATPGLTLAVALVTLAAATRVAAVLLPAHMMPLLGIAAVLWFAAFAGFLGVCGPMLLRRRVSGGGA